MHLKNENQSLQNRYFPEFAASTVMGRYITQKEMDFIDTFLEGEHNRLILDVGGGSGRFAIPLYKKGANIIVLDYDQVPLSILRDKGENISCIRGDGQRLCFKSETFDVVLVIEAIEPVRDKKLLIREIFRVLKNNGILIATLLNKFSYKIFHPNHKKRPQCYFTTYIKFKRRLEYSGFSVEKAYGFNWIPAKRASNNFLIPYYARIEEFLRLKYFPSFNPWVIIKARKTVES